MEDFKYLDYSGFHYRYDYGMSPMENAYHELRLFLAYRLDYAVQLESVDFCRLYHARGITFDSPEQQADLTRRIRESVREYFRIWD